MTPSFDRDSGVRKAAILILAVGDDLAREVFTRLSEAEIRQLGQKAAQLENVTRQEVTQVLLEFKRAFRGGDIPRQGAGTMFQFMVERALGEERARDLLDFDYDDIQEPFAGIRRVESHALAAVLHREHPQTSAVVLASLSEEKAGEIIEQFDLNYAVDVVQRMARLGNPTEDVKRDIGKSLAVELAGLGAGGDPGDSRSQEFAVNVLKTVKRDAADEIFDELEIRDELLAQSMRNQIVTFPDLEALDNRSMQRLLREIDGSVLARAMKGCDQKLADLIFESMSERAADMLRDDLQAMGPTRVSEVEEAQEAVVSTAMQLEEEGVLAIPRGGASDFI